MLARPGGKRRTVDRGGADELLDVQQGELRDADAVGRRARDELHAQYAVAVRALGLGQHGARFLGLGLRALDHRHATAADGVAVELDGGPRVERLVDRFQRGRFLVLAADGHDRALAVDVIQMLIADDGGHAVFAHDFLDHVGLRRLLVLREGQIARHEISAVGARGRGEAGREHLAVLFRTGGEAEIQRRDIAGAAEFLLLDVGLGVGPALEQGIKDGARGFGVRFGRDTQNVGAQFARERRLGRLRLDIVGQRSRGQGCQSQYQAHGKHRNQRMARHETPRKSGTDRQWQRAGLRQTLNRDVNVVRRFRRVPGAVVNALIHLALPCHRHIDRLRRGDAGIGRMMLPPKARFLGDGIPLSV